MKTKLILILSAILMLTALLCGCTITSGVFMDMSHSSSDTSLSASYLKFDGLIAKRVSLKADDEVHFSYQGDDGLTAAVKQGSDVITDITDTGEFTVPADGTYDFTIKGSAENGAFSLSWSIE